MDRGRRKENESLTIPCSLCVKQRRIVTSDGPESIFSALKEFSILMEEKSVSREMLSERLHGSDPELQRFLGGSHAFLPALGGFNHGWAGCG